MIGFEQTRIKPLICGLTTTGFNDVVWGRCCLVRVRVHSLSPHTPVHLTWVIYIYTHKIINSTFQRNGYFSVNNMKGFFSNSRRGFDNQLATQLASFSSEKMSRESRRMQGGFVTYCVSLTERHLVHQQKEPTSELYRRKNRLSSQRTSCSLGPDLAFLAWLIR